MSQGTCITCSGCGKPGGASSLSEEYQGRLSGPGSKARWSSGCRHRTGISARQLVKSMVIPVVAMCEKAL